MFKSTFPTKVLIADYETVPKRPYINASFTLVWTDKLNDLPINVEYNAEHIKDLLNDPRIKTLGTIIKSMIKEEISSGDKIVQTGLFLYGLDESGKKLLSQNDFLVAPCPAFCDGDL